MKEIIEITNEIFLLVIGLVGNLLLFVAIFKEIIDKNKHNDNTTQ